MVVIKTKKIFFGDEAFSSSANQAKSNLNQKK